MQKRLFILMLLPWMLMSCSLFHHRSTAQEIVLPNGLPQHQTPPAFTRVKVIGPLNINLHTGAAHPRLVFHGAPSDLAALTWTVRHNELYIHLGKGYPKEGPVTVDVYSHYLISLKFKGKGTVTGTKLYSKSLDLYLKNKGKTVLEGQIALHDVTLMGPGFTKIEGIHSRVLQLNLSGEARLRLVGVANLVTLNMKDKSWLSLYWVKSRELKAHLKDKAQAQIAGIAKVINVKTCDSSRFNGRYLRADEAYVKTYNQSEADIFVLYEQHGLAHDSSNLYFYELPEMKTNFMAEEGTVLDMREWERVVMEDTDRYNRRL